MARKTKVHIEITAEQMKDLTPLFKMAEKKPNTGMVFAQIYEHGIGNFQFLTPEEVIEKCNELIAYRNAA